MAFYSTRFDVWSLVRRLQEFYMNIYLGSYKNLSWVGVKAERVLGALQGLSLHDTSQSSTQQPFQCIQPNFKASMATQGPYQLSPPPTQLSRGHLPPLPHYHAAGISRYLLCIFYSYPHSLQLFRAGTSILCPVLYQVVGRHTVLSRHCLTFIV